jgi:hypothetical protein
VRVINKRKLAQIEKEAVQLGKASFFWLSHPHSVSLM